jgi:hypothetical protein
MAFLAEKIMTKPEIMDLSAIKRNPNCKNFIVRRDLFGKWYIEFFIDGEKHLVKTRRGNNRCFTTMDAVISYLEESKRCSGFEVFF